MKKMTMQFAWDKAKVRALCLYLGQKNTSLEAELQDFLEKLYRRTVPVPVQAFVENTSGEDAAARLEALLPTVPAKRPLHGHTDGVGAQTREMDKNAP